MKKIFLNWKLDRRGFTLTEILFSVFIAAMIFIVMGNVFIKGNNLFDVLSAQSETQRNGRKVAQALSAAIRQARTGSVTITGGNQLTIDMPIYQVSSGVCSAYAPVADGTAPQSCSVNTDCVTACGNAGSMTCSSSICRRNYTFSISSVNGISQLIVTAPGEADQILGNGVTSVLFENQAANSNLNTDEIRFVLTTSGTVTSEKRTHTLSTSGIAQIRN